MDNAKLQAAHDLKKLSVMLGGIIALGDDIESLGSIEQATLEAESRLKALQEEARKASEELARLVQLGTSAINETQRKTAEAAREVEQLLFTAKEVAEEIVAKAKASAVAEREAAEQHIAIVDAQVAEQRQVLAALDEAVKDRNLQLETLRTTVAEVKRQIQAI